jgi:hypothetical protein
MVDILATLRTNASEHRTCQDMQPDALRTGSLNFNYEALAHHCIQATPRSAPLHCLGAPTRRDCRRALLLKWITSQQRNMKTLKLIALIVTIYALSPVAGTAQDLAAFKVTALDRPFVFILRLTPQDAASGHSTNATPKGVEGLQTILAKGFNTTRDPGGVIITFIGAVVCRAQRDKGEQSSSSVLLVDGMPIRYPAGTSVLALGRSIPLADLSEKTFAPPTTFSDVHEGEAAIKKLKEMGLEPPEDMDWQKATNRESSQPKH